MKKNVLKCYDLYRMKIVVFITYPGYIRFPNIQTLESPLTYEILQMLNS